MFDIKELVEIGINDGKDSTAMLKILADNLDAEHNKIETFEKLYHEVYNNHLCDRFCKKMVERMHHNHKLGEHWTLEQTNEVAKKVNISFSGNEDDYTPYEFYTAIHMMYYDYSNVFEESSMSIDPALYAKMADAYLADEDAPKGKLVNYFFFVEKNIADKA